jgi:hypothetical protein
MEKKNHLVIKYIMTGGDVHNIDVPHWGPPIWNFLHTSALYLDNLKDVQKKNKWIALIKHINIIIPCGNCRDEARLIVETNPPSTTVTDLFDWTVWYHNRVNVKLNKTALGINESRKLWEIEQPQQVMESVGQMIIFNALHFPIYHTNVQELISYYLDILEVFYEVPRRHEFEVKCLTSSRDLLHGLVADLLNAVNFDSFFELLRMGNTIDICSDFQCEIQNHDTEKRKKEIIETNEVLFVPFGRPSHVQVICITEEDSSKTLASFMHVVTTTNRCSKWKMSCFFVIYATYSVLDLSHCMNTDSFTLLDNKVYIANAKERLCIEHEYCRKLFSDFITIDTVPHSLTGDASLHFGYDSILYFVVKPMKRDEQQESSGSAAAFTDFVSHIEATLPPLAPSGHTFHLELMTAFSRNTEIDPIGWCDIFNMIKVTESLES